ncbi:hypothetical protein CANINC_001185 [Pichia inconspicua]|uniref:DNA recombination and repair protein Rad51-like C-terminal domain-containing protein n=1 Tax=Pichia inconspicua TaxID=52247 RepID=A0A4T0X441_9ASCO|nr:hypothetical protein CANINC_001185 [[Candida] inconspicua]
MQGTSLLTLQELSWFAQSGISQLDAALVGGAGFTTGIYDLDAAIDLFSAGVYELIFTTVISVLASGGEVLFISDSSRIPWFKLTKQRMYRPHYASQIHEIDVHSLIDLIILFKNTESLKKYKLIVINSFGTYYTKYTRNLKHTTPSAETVNKFNQSLHKLFHIMQRTCLANNSMIFTVGSMKTFSQEIRPTPDPESEESQLSLVVQKILVPVLSLSSEINVYYTNRIILYRDWVYDTNDTSTPLISGLPPFEESVQLLAEGRLRSLPHWRCLNLRPHADSQSSWSSGFFLVDNNFNIVDINSDDVPDEEVEDSQVYFLDCVE